MQSTLLRVSGIFRTGIQAIDAHIIQMPLPEAQALLGVSDRVTQIAVLLEHEGDSLMVAQGLRKQLTGDPVEILPWRESMPTLAQLFLLDDAFNYVMNGVVLAMVGLGILNTILMRVIQRRYEFGLCLASGTAAGAACRHDHWRVAGADGDQPRSGAGAGVERRALFRHRVGWICAGSSRAAFRQPSFSIRSSMRA